MERSVIRRGRFGDGPEMRNGSDFGPDGRWVGRLAGRRGWIGGMLHCGGLLDWLCIPWEVVERWRLSPAWRLVASVGV